MKSTITNTTSCADPFESDWISVAQALSQIDAAVTAITEFENLPIRDCLSRICGAAVISPINVPGHANSAMDGYAIASSSLAAQGITRFQQVGTAFAGKNFDALCAPGECVRIMTGAVIPDGTDTVVMQEQAELEADGQVLIEANHRSGENIRYPGEDIQQGEAILQPGARINPADLGILASLGIASLEVYRKPVVAFFSTGDELVSLGAPLAKGKIYDSNRYTLYGMLAQLPVEILDLGVVADDPELIRAALLAAADQADLVITTGGVSVGEADYIKPILEQIGRTEFWKIAIKPGRPLTFGNIDNCLFMGLPGNPVAVMVTFSQFVLPAIRKLSGANSTAPALISARALDKMRKKSGRMELLRGIATLDHDQAWQVSKTGKQGSGILTSMSRANCFIVLPESNQGVEIGDQVKIQLFDGQGI